MESPSNIKENYLAYLGKEEASKLDTLAFAIIDQAIENIESGQANIEGRKPATRKEYFMLITYTAEIARKQLIEIARKAAVPDDTVQDIPITFRGHKFKIKVRGGSPTDIA